MMNYNENNAKRIWNYLNGKGLNAFAVAGLMGNIYSESCLRPDNLQNSYTTKLGLTDEQYTLAVDNGTYTNFVFDKAGYGLCQWTSSGRKQGLFNFCKERGCSISDLDMQLDFLWLELNSGYKSVLKALQGVTTANEAARVVMLKFERPADQSEAAQLKRVGYAENFYTKYATKEVLNMGKVKIVIDAGHGLNTKGKRVTLNGYADTREWWLNDRIADKLEKLLAAYNCEVLRVDDTTGRKDVELADRVAKANSWGADMYISIHHNAGVGGRAGGGTVVYYYSSKAERATQAKELYNALIAETGLVGNRAQKVIKNGFYVIKNTKMPAFLIENGFMDSTTDVPIILTEAHANKTAQGLLNFLVDELKLIKDKNIKPTEKEPVNTPSVPKNDTFKVKVICDALNIRTGAGTNHAIKGVIKDKGTYTIVETSGSWGKLKSGAGWISLKEKYVKRI